MYKESVEQLVGSTKHLHKVRSCELKVKSGCVNVFHKPLILCIQPQSKKKIGVNPS